MKRNHEIELWRFLMALLIVNFHGCFKGFPLWFTYGRIGVEFFFLLSGYLLASSVVRQADRKANPSWNEINDENMSLIGRRIASFLPETFCVAFLTCMIYCAVYMHELRDCVDMCMRSLFGEVCCLKMSGLIEKGSNGAAWYLSTLIFCTAIIYPILRRWGVSLTMFAVGWLLLGAVYLQGTACDFSGVLENIGTYKGNIRGFSEMLIGASLFPLTMRIRKVPFSEVGVMLLTVLKWAMSVLVFLYAYRASFLGHNFGMALLAICVLLVLMFSEKCLDSKWYRYPIFLFLGRFSLLLFLSHGFYAEYLSRMLPSGMSHIQIWVSYYVCSFATAFLVMGLAGKVRFLLSLMLDKSEVPSTKS